jgi:hypothetical protein
MQLYILYQHHRSFTSSQKSIEREKYANSLLEECKALDKAKADLQKDDLSLAGSLGLGFD